MKMKIGKKRKGIKDEDKTVAANKEQQNKRFIQRLQR